MYLSRFPRVQGHTLRVIVRHTVYLFTWIYRMGTTLEAGNVAKGMSYVRMHVQHVVMNSAWWFFTTKARCTLYCIFSTH